MIRLPHRVFVLAYIAAILAVTVLSLIPQPQLDAPEGTDKALHLLAYGVIAGCGGLGFATWKRRIFAGAVAIGIGIFLEFAQDAWAGRNGSAADALSNTAGVMLGLIAAYAVLKFWQRLYPSENTG
ncbi:MAG: VanZ family protein [Rhodospirillaceae bacterium]|nr:VanZ family protein [Rhodospirillaceae bacterium]MBT6402919.1 VanZ family protein [Rhodospirillaceae bacterium]MBT6536458.1 VanZ family protein [Rhodospirillaceae bacterium]MBT7362891.1 VanZ family protein [Rhodospirillaceae bacterium]